MKTKSIFPLIIILFLFTTTGCTPKESGNNLTGFCNRMNTYNEGYNLTPDGYIFDDTENTYTRFFVFGDKTEMMLQFKLDEKSRIKQMNIALTPQKNTTDSESFAFITDCITAFCHDNEISNELIEKIDLENALTTITLKTKSAEYGKISIKTDTTEIGTVISLYNDNYTLS
jgi:hypothetical protein